jgi:histidine triad (HIT) family protein
MRYDPQNVFARILRREIPARIVYEDERCLAFHDVAPAAPVHLLVIPKAPIAALGDATEQDRELLGHLLWAAAEVARREGLTEAGFRTVINHGARANQSVFHLHVHLLGGREFTWPPG